MPLAGHNCAISRHFAGISIFEKRITQKPFTLHLFLGIPCVYRGFRGRRVQFHPSSPFIFLPFPGRICCPNRPWRRPSVMPLTSIMPFVTFLKEVILLSTTIILRESRGTYRCRGETRYSLVRTKVQDGELSYILSLSHASRMESICLNTLATS